MLRPWFVNCLYVARFTIVHLKTQIKFPLLLFLDDKTSFISEEYLGEARGGGGVINFLSLKRKAYYGGRRHNWEGELNRGFTAENEIIEPVNEYSRLISLSPLSYLWTTLLDVLRWWVQCIATWVITLYLFLVTDVPFLLFVNLNAHTIIILVIKLFNNYSSSPNGLRVNSP